MQKIDAQPWTAAKVETSALSAGQVGAKIGATLQFAALFSLSL
jgi:hypothetical protein